ncbi:hypothetical protein [Pseudoneobacillus sp. C159]
MSEPFQNQSLGLAITSMDLSGDDSNLNEDRYEIYVNNDFIGYKTLLNASDELRDVDDFIKRQGLKNFQTEQHGDHYHIRTDEVERMKAIIDVYCQNR